MKLRTHFRRMIFMLRVMLVHLSFYHLMCPQWIRVQSHSILLAQPINVRNYGKRLRLRLHVMMPFHLVNYHDFCFWFGGILRRIWSQRILLSKFGVSRQR